MVATRKATGSLPTPRRENVADIDASDDDGHLEEPTSGEENVKRPDKKRSRKRRITTSEDHTPKGEQSPGSSEERMNSVGDEGKPTVEPGGDFFSNFPRNRMDSLITGVISKNVMEKSRQTSKTAKRRVQLRKGDLGKLARVMELSVEVFCEIASYLTPADLLQLSRTSRSLREFLLSKSSKAVWVGCLAATGIPPCPPDMSEPQYANLYFEKECHACGYPRVERNTGHLRIRLCRGCSTLNVVQGKELVEEYFERDVSRTLEIYTLLPWSDLNVDDVDSFETMHSKVSKRYFLKYDFLQVVRAYLQTKTGSAERKSFVEKRHELVANIAKSVRVVASWQQRRQRDQFEADDGMCKRRKGQIRDKLRGLGYSYEEIDSLWHMPFDPNNTGDKWRRIVYQPRELTDRIWKNILPKLEDLIQSKRKFEESRTRERNREKRRSELVRWYKESVFHDQLDKKDLAPLRFVDLCLIPCVKALIEEDDCRVEITPERWRFIEEKLPDLWTENAEKVERDCLESLIKCSFEAGDAKFILSRSELGLEGENNHPSVLRRANIFFVKWPQYMKITTFAGYLSSMREHLFDTDPMYPPPWHKVTLSASRIAIRAANALLSSLSLPKETAIETMEGKGRVFVCQQCDPIFRKRMTWHELVLHVYQEVKEYLRMQEPRTICNPVGLQTGVRWSETHKISPDEAGTPIVLIDADFEEIPVNSLTVINQPVNGAPIFMPCMLCKRCGVSNKFIYKEQLVAHTRAYHLTEA